MTNVAVDPADLPRRPDPESPDGPETRDVPETGGSGGEPGQAADQEPAGPEEAGPEAPSVVREVASGEAPARAPKSSSEAAPEAAPAPSPAPAPEAAAHPEPAKPKRRTGGGIPPESPFDGGLKLDRKDRGILRGWAEGGFRSRLSVKAEAILMSADGRSATSTAKALGVATSSVTKWRTDFLKSGPKGLSDPGSPRPPGAVVRRESPDAPSPASPPADPASPPVASPADPAAAPASAAAPEAGPSVPAPAPFPDEAPAPAGGAAGAARGGFAVGAADRRTLRRWINGSDSRLAAKAKAILLAAEGHPLSDVARATGFLPNSLPFWRNRFLAEGPIGLVDRRATRTSPGPGGRPAAPAKRPRRPRALGKGRRFTMPGEHRRILLTWTYGTDARLAKRATAVILLSDGLHVKEVAQRLEATPATVADWLRRFRAGGPEALKDRRRPESPERAG